MAFKALNSVLRLDPMAAGAHTPAPSAELFQFLLFHGRAVLGGDDGIDPPLTAEAVRAAVKEYSTAADSADSAAHFSTRFGTVDVTGDHVLFTSADGSRSIRTSAHHVGRQFEEPPLSATVRGPDGRAQTSALPPDQVQRVLEQIKAKAGGSLNAAQFATVRGRLFAPNQELVRLDSPGPLTWVRSSPNEVIIQFESGWLTIGRDGHVMQDIGGQVMVFPGFFTAVMPPAGILTLESLASALLALCLLAGGIATLASSPKSRLLLQLYSWPQAVVVLMGLATMAWLWHAQKRTISIADPSAWPVLRPSLATSAMITAAVLILGAVFAAFLLVALRSPTLRNYHATLSGR